MDEVKRNPEDRSTTRRDRLREATREEIVAAAQQLVADGHELSMRAVARSVGMTAPALYRYVRDHEDLVDQVGGALYDQLLDALVSARDTVDLDDLPGRLTAMAHAFRGWALTHRNEYGLLFANPLTAKLKQATSRTHAGGQAFGQAFGEVFVQLWQRGLIVLPRPEDIDPRLRSMLEASSTTGPDLPLPLRYVFVRQWARLYGMVTLEAFGHLSWALEDSLALFEEMLADNHAELACTSATASAQQQATESP